MLNKATAKIAIVLAVVAVALLGILPVAAQQGPSATRSFSSPTVAPGADLTVTITFADVGPTARITETLPAGFTYASSSVASENVSTSGQDVGFTLLQVTSPFTYTVHASGTAGSYDFSGMLRVGPRMDHTVGGDTSVTVEAAAATATPTSTATATPIPTGPSATRSFSSTAVQPGAEITVTIAFANPGETARITETLPGGFAYVSSSVASENVSTSGQNVTFSLFQVTSPFTYTVTASDTARSYDFSGMLRVGPEMDHTVGGDTRVTVQVPVGPASRSFSAARVDPGAEDVTVTINLGDYGPFGRVTETLPTGFTYVSSSLDDSQVNASGNPVRFTLQGEESFSYVVTAPDTTGDYTFSGQLRDSRTNDTRIGGATSLRVAPKPTPTATPTATSEPEPTATPRRVRRATPEPTPTPIPATPVPAVKSMATPTPTPTPTPEPTLPSVGDSSPSLVLPAAALGVLLVMGGGATFLVRRLRQR